MSHHFFTLPELKEFSRGIFYINQGVHGNAFLDIYNLLSENVWFLLNRVFAAIISGPGDGVLDEN
jgi:hypothetical protein